jgi:uncharacterized protein
VTASPSACGRTPTRSSRLRSAWSRFHSGGLERNATHPVDIALAVAALLIGGIAGSLLRLEVRVEGFGGWLQKALAGETSSEERHRFIEGFVVSSLIFCTGPLTILGALNDGLGNGAR